MTPTRTPPIGSARGGLGPNPPCNLRWTCRVGPSGLCCDESDRHPSPKRRDTEIQRRQAPSRTSTAVPGQRQDGVKGILMYWLALIVSGVLEAVWATADRKS